jgi:D-3-phosphoglycerate dehydrogenase
VQLEHHLAVFRYRDVPGMLGRVGTVLGEEGINIVSAAVGRRPDEETTSSNGEAAMVVTADAPIPQDVVERIVASDGFVAGRTVSL